VTPTKDTVGTAVREIVETDLKYAGMDLPDVLADFDLYPVDEPWKSRR
jgi:hypothetical protein